jgi:hypothetical protein
MGMILLIALGALGVRLYLELRSAKRVNNSLSPLVRQAVANNIEQRHAYIIEDGLQRHQERQRRHPILYGWIKYNPKQYLCDHLTDWQRYPL